MEKQSKADELWLHEKLTLQVKKLQDLFKELKLRRQRDVLPSMAEELSLFSYLCSFLDLDRMAMLSHMGRTLTLRLYSEERPISQEYLRILSRIFKTLVQMLQQVKRDGGRQGMDSRTDGQASYSESSDQDLAPLLKALRKQLIYRETHQGFRSLRLDKDQDFSHGLRIPRSMLNHPNPQHWLSIVYIDLNRQEDSLKLIKTLQEGEDLGEILMQGRLHIPEDQHNRQADIMPYYLLLSSREDSQEWLRKNRISGNLLRQLSKPEIQEIPPREDTTEPPQNTEIIKEVPIASQELLDSLNALAERNKREEERDFYRQLDLRRSKGKMEGKGASIGFKLVLIISLVIITSLSAMTYLSSFFFMADVQNRIEEENLATSSLLATKTEQDLWGIFNRAQLLILGLRGTDEDQEYIDFFFQKNPEFIYLGIPGGPLALYNKDYLNRNNLTEEYVEQVILPQRQEIYDEVRLGISASDAQVFNLSPFFNNPVTGTAFPYRLGVDNHSLVVLWDTERVLGSSIRSTGSKLSLVLTRNGEIIAHPDLNELLNNPSYQEHPVIEDIRQGEGNNKQIRYAQSVDDPELGIISTMVLGAFRRIDFGGLVFITQVEESQVFGSVLAIRTRNIYIMMIVLSLSILVVYFYSRRITNPIGQLVVATKYIEQGNYRLPLRVRSRDETGILTKSFIDMGQGLEEKERLKDTFGRFVNQELAEMATKGELALGGETKEATVFFSDIREFTKISEQLSPEEVVTFLNEYMTLMVQCVNEAGGFVDKFIGDAIMAVWGAPISRGNDEENAINAALKMRAALSEYNKGRGGVKKPIINIGIGINAGPLLAGQIGSETRMEYTVIGDTVNLASRIEGLNKPMGTDILISQDCKQRVEGIYHLVEMNKITVKGKAQPQQIYAVLGRRDDPQCPQNLVDLRKRVGIRGDFSNIADGDKKEVKYEIIS